jgi:hypothetical protein
MLSLSQARRRLATFRWTGRTLVVASAVLLLFGVLKAVYLLATQAPFGIERAVLSVPANLIVAFYNWLTHWAPQVTQLLWEHSPDLDIHRPIFANGGFIATYLVLLIGGYLCGQANRIELRIAKTMQRVEELMWEESLRRQFVAAADPAQAMAHLNLSISLIGQDAPWYQRPWGLVLFGIALPMMVEVLKVVVGLAKLP